LRAELALERPAGAADGMGGTAEAWELVATLFARLEPAGATGRPGAGGLVETVTHRVRLRHDGRVAAGMRFRLGERAFHILTVHDPDETGRYLVCGTREEKP
jgi:SPP1 family predicted phage head-tail adaptor